MRHNDIPFYFRKHIKKYRWLIILMQRIRRKCDTGDSKFLHRPKYRRRVICEMKN